MNHSNKDIDPTRTEKNYDLVNDEPVDYKEHVGEIIDSQRGEQEQSEKMRFSLMNG